MKSILCCQKEIRIDHYVIYLIFFKILADAQSERQTSIYSPIFYSSPNGYKMRVRLYPGGDGNARRTHMSIFFVLMRGEYDAVLEFPFSFKVTFCLFDQTPQQRHMIDSFRPDTKSNSFQRPRSDMNIASGIPKFCPLTIVHQDNNPYVRDDTMCNQSRSRLWWSTQNNSSICIKSQSRITTSHST